MNRLNPLVFSQRLLEFPESACFWDIRHSNFPEQPQYHVHQASRDSKPWHVINRIEKENKF